MNSAPSRATIDRHLDAVYPSFALLAGVSLGLFTVLAKGPMTLEALAEALEADALCERTRLTGGKSILEAKPTGVSSCS
ncbi:MAG: hypothetical protein GTO67_13640 [Gammaproteobacteria bacterium]|nr:hypothetical protein [Gammaproteobacteria bacterium]NIN39611.1 hypothetical protein [Gammaproteobacteria bacterium]NIO25168.1 hypothetical protein [Gammaproteobacteria bacterium]NIO65797.1 hypothetical protein [Gammaproteobacteria bacterium]NIP45766.1 hypothetical protein [Gammaproteobacteria bacterium]